jgi:hypothetical protein
MCTTRVSWRAEDVEIAVEHCGVCHSDLSVLDNEWGITTYPLVPGHEAIGRVAMPDVGGTGGAMRGFQLTFFTQQDRKHQGNTGGPQLHILSIRKRLIANACAWLRYLGYLREPIEPIPFGSQLDEYSGWSRQECGLSDATIARFCGTVRQFLRWYGPFGRQRTYLSARRYEGGFDDTIPNLSTSAPNKPPQAAPLSAPIVTRSTACGVSWIRRLSTRPNLSGRSTRTWRSKRPARSSAGSRISGRLVAARMITPVDGSKPSISTRSWFNVCSFSSCPPMP